MLHKAISYKLRHPSEHYIFCFLDFQNWTWVQILDNSMQIATYIYLAKIDAVRGTQPKFFHWLLNLNTIEIDNQ